MSLLDTINKAREEATKASIDSEIKASEATSDSTTAISEAPSGFTKKSAARAKPSREAASNVHIINTNDYKSGKSGKRASEMTKRERKEQQRITREIEDRRASASRIILEGHDSYKRSQRIWWILLGVGMGLTIVSWLLSSQFSSQQTEYANAFVIVSVILLVAAYALIIIAFVYDWRMVRPMRKAADAEVARMSDKRVLQYLNIKTEEAAKQETEQAKAKNTRTRRSNRHQQHK